MTDIKFSELKAIYGPGVEFAIERVGALNPTLTVSVPFESRVEFNERADTREQMQQIDGLVKMHLHELMQRTLIHQFHADALSHVSDTWEREVRNILLAATGSKAVTEDLIEDIKRKARTPV